LPAGSAAAQLLRLLDLHGVELLPPTPAPTSPRSSTPGSLDRAAATRLRPAGRACPHENTVIALAHGHALLSGRPQAAMGHVNVGTANMGLGLINARRAGCRCCAWPGHALVRAGVPGVRSNFVQWGQDTFDQGAMFREFTKWDYELRSPHALDTVVERAPGDRRVRPPRPRLPHPAQGAAVR
jgi:acetolactate synthase-1/2/3 large subunit